MVGGPFRARFGIIVSHGESGVTVHRTCRIVSIVRQFTWYAGMGALGTLAHYAVLISLVESGSAGDLTASTLGFAVGALVNYLLNYRYTFRSRKSHREAFARFMTVALLGLAVNFLIMVLATRLADLNYVLAQLIATGAVLATTFLTNRGWTFRESADAAKR